MNTGKLILDVGPPLGVRLRVGAAPPQIARMGQWKSTGPLGVFQSATRARPQSYLTSLIVFPGYPEFESNKIDAKGTHVACTTGKERTYAIAYCMEPIESNNHARLRCSLCGSTLLPVLRNMLPSTLHSIQSIMQMYTRTLSQCICAPSAMFQLIHRPPMSVYPSSGCTLICATRVINGWGRQ